jgi:hypothetical protein
MPTRSTAAPQEFDRLFAPSFLPCREKASKFRGATLLQFTGRAIAARISRERASDNRASEKIAWTPATIDPPSRRDEESNGARNRARCNVLAGVPDPLTITNGLVRSIGGSWEGTVSPQGAVVMRDGLSRRADGQIDSQGAIRVQYSGTSRISRIKTKSHDGAQVAMSSRATL